jgi:hypothetical protein
MSSTVRIRYACQASRSSNAMMSRRLPRTNRRIAPPRRRGPVETAELFDEEIALGEQFAAEVVGGDLERGIDLVESSEDLIHSPISSGSVSSGRSRRRPAIRTRAQGQEMRRRGSPGGFHHGIGAHPRPIRSRRGAGSGRIPARQGGSSASEVRDATPFHASTQARHGIATAAKSIGPIEVGDSGTMTGPARGSGSGSSGVWTHCTPLSL